MINNAAVVIIKRNLAIRIRASFQRHEARWPFRETACVARLDDVSQPHNSLVGTPVFRKERDTPRRRTKLLRSLTGLPSSQIMVLDPFE